MPRKRIASARITAKLGSDDFSTTTFAYWLSVSRPRGFTHNAAATIEEIRPPVDGLRGITGNSEGQRVLSGAAFRDAPRDSSVASPTSARRHGERKAYSRAG
jgi:hypothetical protein